MVKQTVIRSRAPLRISFAGGGTEISPYVEEFGGLVLNATLSMHALTTIEPSKDGKIHLYANDTGAELTFDLTNNLPIESSLPLHCAVYNHMVNRYWDGRPLALKISTHCDAPPGSGLGSSSTLTVAMLGAFNRYMHLHLEEHQIARTAFEIERLELGLKGGHQDQYAAAFGGVNLIEFHKQGEVIVNSLKIPPSILRELESSLILYFTGQSRSSGDIIAAQARNLSAGKPSAIDNLHEIKALVPEMRTCLISGNIPRLGTLLHKSWEIKKATADTISNERIDDIYSEALDEGAIGGKITGAGGGGFMMLIVNPTERLGIIKKLTSHGGFVLPTSFSYEGVQAWEVTNR